MKKIYNSNKLHLEKYNFIEFMKLTQLQKKLIKMPSSPCIQNILGGAATGKSTIIKYYVLNLLHYERIEKHIIITPSKENSKKLKEEFAYLTKSGDCEPCIKTWESLSFDILKHATSLGIYKQSYEKIRLLSGAEQDMLLSEILATYTEDNLVNINLPKFLKNTIKTLSFRKYIRHFFDICAENYITPTQIQSFATDNNFDIFIFLSKLYKDYVNIMTLRFPDAFSHAELLSVTIKILQLNSDFKEKIKKKYQHILIDDLQDASSLHINLLFELCGLQTYILACSNPDVASKSFRGAKPDSFMKLKSIASNLQKKYIEFSLKTVFGFNGEIAKIYDQLSSKLPSFDKGLRRYNKQYQTNIKSEVYMFNLNSLSEEENKVIYQLYYLHLNKRIQWSDFAVICRNNSQLSRFKNLLDYNNIPTYTTSTTLPLYKEKSVEPLLEIFSIAYLLNKDKYNDQDQKNIVDKMYIFFQNIYINMSNFDLNKLKKHIYVCDAKNYNRNFISMLKSSNFQKHISHLDKKIVKKIVLFQSLYKIANNVINNQEIRTEEALWQIWKATNKSEVWKKKSLQHNQHKNNIYDHYLDMVIALFSLASKYSERNKLSNIQNFILYTRNQEVAEDFLFFKRKDYDSVTLLTPVSAVGKRYKCVIIPALQEKEWSYKNLNLELFGIDLFIKNSLKESFTKKKNVWIDELRMFINCISRAQQFLIITSVTSNTCTPSQFFIEAYKIIDKKNILQNNNQNFSIRSLIIDLRKILENKKNDIKKRKEAAKLLSIMNKNNEPEADPKNWWGFNSFSTYKPFYDKDEKINISPSLLSNIIKCPLCWMISSVTGAEPSNSSINLGKTIHRLASLFPLANFSELKNELLKYLKINNCINLNDKKRAMNMLSFVADYTQLMKQENRKLLSTEVKFALNIDKNIALHGIIDRLEKDSYGNLLAVDYKTGKKIFTKDELKNNLQMLCYQLAIEKGAFQEYGKKSAGAIIVNLGTKNKNLSIYKQEPLNKVNKEKILHLLQEASSIMSSANFTTVHSLQEFSKMQIPSKFISHICLICENQIL